MNDRAVLLREPIRLCCLPRRVSQRKPHFYRFKMCFVVPHFYHFKSKALNFYRTPTLCRLRGSNLGPPIPPESPLRARNRTYTYITSIFII